MDKQIYDQQTVLHNNKDNISIIIFWGAIWGIMEATIGYALHILPFRVPTGSILFPIGFYFMQKSYKETQDLKSIFYTSSIAASIKLINLFIPMTPVIKVLNPSASILLEGLAVASVFYFLKPSKELLKYVHVVIMSLAWRMGYYIINFAIFIPLVLVKRTSIVDKSRFIEFFFINGFINSLLIYFCTKVPMGVKREIRIKYNPILSGSVLVAAFIIQWLV